jgi:hypothetical protein
MNRSVSIFVSLVASLLLLLAAYMGAYYANLERAWFMAEIFEAGGIDAGAQPALYPVYRVEHRLVRKFFWPANQLDRVIRPEYWKLK